MGTVTPAFARALARAAGLELTEDGRLLDGTTVVRRISTDGGKLTHAEYFELVDWVARNDPDRTGLPLRYAGAVDIDNLGALGLAMKTAPRLSDSLRRAERYFRLLTDTVAYELDDAREPCMFTLSHRSSPHPALALRNECALCGFGRIFREFVGAELRYDAVSFRHECPGELERYEAFFGCPVRFGAEQNALVLTHQMLDLPTRLGDPAVSRFLTAHLDAELGALPDGDSSLDRRVAEHLSRVLSTGIPRVADVAKAMGMSERTLHRRLSETDVSYQEILEDTQRSLAENLLSASSFSIAEIAFLTGFSEQSSFSRAFKRWLGQSPGTYRRSTLPA